jgi:hypothetical protein
MARPGPGEIVSDCQSVTVTVTDVNFFKWPPGRGPGDSDPAVNARLTRPGPVLGLIIISDQDHDDSDSLISRVTNASTDPRCSSGRVRVRTSGY